MHLVDRSDSVERSPGTYHKHQWKRRRRRRKRRKRMSCQTSSSCRFPPQGHTLEKHLPCQRTPANDEHNVSEHVLSALPVCFVSLV